MDLLVISSVSRRQDRQRTAVEETPLHPKAFGGDAEIGERQMSGAGQSIRLASGRTEFCDGPLAGRAATSARKLSRFFLITSVLITPNDPIKGLFDLFDFGLGQIFKVEQRIPRLRVDPDQLVEFEMKGASVAALGALDQEDHQKGNYGCSRVDHELPRIGPTE
jgi:hypothetical protein